MIIHLSCIERFPYPIAAIQLTVKHLEENEKIHK